MDRQAELVSEASGHFYAWRLYDEDGEIAEMGMDKDQDVARAVCEAWVKGETLH